MSKTKQQYAKTVPDSRTRRYAPRRRNPGSLGRHTQTVALSRDWPQLDRNREQG
jgi:hypothetical protein